MPKMEALVEGTAILAVWWAIWTLADLYLIRFSPWSEFVVLAVVGVGWWGPAFLRRLQTRLRKGKQLLNNV